MKHGQWLSGLWALLGATVLGVAWPAACGGKAIVDREGTGGTGAAPTTTTVTTTGTTTATTTTPSTTTSTVTSTMPVCVQTCIDLFECTQEDDLCPGLSPADGPEFIEGCIEMCEQNPALVAVVNPADCETTVLTLVSLSPEFAEACLGT